METTQAAPGAQAGSPENRPPVLQPHPAAELFPDMGEAEFDALVVDILAHGQREPIVICDGLVLDGRHRLRACLKLGIKPIMTDWDETLGSPKTFVISKNLHRRHLSEGQRAMVAKKLATFKLGDNQHAQICAPSQDEAAALLHVSRRSVQHAAVVLDKGAPELVEAVERGDIPVSTAAQLVHLPKQRQRDIASSGKKAATKAAKQAKPAATKPDIISPPDVAALPKGEPRRAVMDPDFQAEAEAAARDLEIERDERIALSGATELAAENDGLRKQIAALDRRIAALQQENQSLKYREKMWRERAIAAGWKGRADA